jgi:hypothetical protein
VGSYWLLADAIDVQLALIGSDGRAAGSWDGQIRRGAQISSLSLLPGEDLSPLRETDREGPVALTLLSGKGEDPLYRFGEQFTIRVHSDADAWLYCYYRMANGDLLQILPNPHHRDTHLRGGYSYEIPENASSKDRWIVEAPAGEELVKCFAVTRNVSDELPSKLRGQSLAPLPKGTAAELSGVFARLPNAHVTETSMLVTVRE